MSLGHLMRFGKWMVVAFGAGAVLCGPAGAQSVMQPGGWQMTMKVSATDPATGASKAANESTSRVCLTKEYLSKDPYLTPGVDKEKMEQKHAKCTISDAKRTASSASWKMACTMVDGSSVDMTIRNTASPRRLTSEIQQVIRKGGNSGVIQIVMDSTFLGQCTSEMLAL